MTTSLRKASIRGSTLPLWGESVSGFQNPDIDGAFRQLVEKMNIVIFTDLADEDFTPIYISPQIQQLLGYSQEEWLADPKIWKRSLHPDDHDRVLAAASAEDPDFPFICEYRMLARDGRTVWIREESVTIHGVDGMPALFQGVFIDITAQKRAEARLQEAEARYRVLVEQLPAILYICDAADGLSLRYVSPQVQDILGYSVDELLASSRAWMETIHPDDTEFMHSQPDEPYQAGDRATFEWRACTRDGRVVWFRNEALLVGDAECRPLYWQGILTDITAQKEAEEALRQLSDKYRHLLDNANDVILTFDTTGRLTYANRAFRCHTGYEVEEALQMHVLDLVYVEDRLNVAARVDALLRHEDGNWSESFRVVTKSGSIHFAEASPSVVEENGLVVGVQAIIRDVTSQQEREQQLVHRAYHDDLTGLPNRSQFIERLDQRLQRPEQLDEAFAVLFIDLDNFKAINDAMGHAAGDRALKIAARRMRNVLRDHDIVARFGGDEFAILLTKLGSTTEAEEIAQRLIEALSEPIEIDGQEFVLSASIGVTRPSDSAEPAEALLRHADMATYESKMLGKNQFRVFGTSRPASIPTSADHPAPGPPAAADDPAVPILD